MYERETLRWINDMKPGSTLVDVGANVGMYSIFAATRGVEVIAIEPEATNYSTLVTNIRANRLEDMVTTVCGGCTASTVTPSVAVAHAAAGAMTAPRNVRARRAASAAA